VVEFAGHRLGDVLSIQFQQASHVCCPRLFLLRAGGGFGGVRRLAGTDVAEHVLTRSAEALFLAVVAEPMADPDATIALGAIKHHVGDINRHFLGEPPALRVLLTGTQVLVDAVHAFDHDLVSSGDHPEHLGDSPIGGGAPVVAGDHFHLIDFPNVHGLLAIV
jgi:hypothetical protein